MTTAPLLVVGATGGVGQILVRRLLKRKQPVRALVRDASRARELLGADVELFVGDTRRLETLTDALTGVRAVCCAIQASIPVGSNRPRTVNYEGVRNLAAAARAAGVQHFVLVSCTGVTRANHPRNLLGRYLTYTFLGEEAVRRSRIPYTIVRASRLLDDPGHGRLRFYQGDRASGPVSRADLAEVCLQALDYNGARNTTFEVEADADAPPADWDALFSPLEPDD